MPEIQISPASSLDIHDLAEMHYEYFAHSPNTGFSLAKFGKRFLRNAFYQSQISKSSFFCDIVRVDQKAAAFSIYSADRSKVFREETFKERLRQAFEAGISLILKPTLLPGLLANARYLFGKDAADLPSVQGWWILFYVRPEYRSAAFYRATRTKLSHLLYKTMNENLFNAGCANWYGVIHPENAPMNNFMVKVAKGELYGQRQAQGMVMNYYIAETKGKGA